jgi:hypothetical protein
MVTLNLADWLSLFTTMSGYEPARTPAGSVATSLWFANDTRFSVVVAKTTVGASPEGLKLVPVMVMRLIEVLSTALSIAGAVDAALRPANIRDAREPNSIRLESRRVF